MANTIFRFFAADLAFSRELIVDRAARFQCPGRNAPWDGVKHDLEESS